MLMPDSMKEDMYDDWFDDRTGEFRNIDRFLYSENTVREMRQPLRRAFGVFGPDVDISAFRKGRAR